jgi:hypothetical protein
LIYCSSCIGRVFFFKNADVWEDILAGREIADVNEVGAWVTVFVDEVED